MIEFTKLQMFVLWAIPTLFAITLHEVAHGYIALKCGDRTAQMLGRLSLNPTKHIDPVGTVLIPSLMFFLGGFIFGWAKPVPVSWQNLKNRKLGMALVAAAGPCANLIMALGWALLWKASTLWFTAQQPLGAIFGTLGQIGILINVLLAGLNLVPIPPLDGSRIVASFLPPKMEWQYSRIEPYGFFIILALMVTGILGKFLGPIIIFFYGILAHLLGLPVY